MLYFKENRLISFFIILGVYILAAGIGIATAIMLVSNYSMALWLAILLADIAATVVTFVFSLIFRNASVYDPYWSVQPPIIIFALTMYRGSNLLGIITSIVVLIWAVRLTFNWAITFKNLNHQDWRYTMLCQTTGKLYPIINFIGIHLVPTLIVYTCIMPTVQVITANPKTSVASLFALLISVLAIAIEAVADIQMHRYQKNRTTTFIKTGLWTYSRHPNYFGEILMWWGIGLSAFLALGNLYLLSGALLNTLLFLFVSIPLAENRQAKKEGYVEYKNRTRMLLPIKK